MLDTLLLAAATTAAFADGVDAPIRSSCCG